VATSLVKSPKSFLNKQYMRQLSKVRTYNKKVKCLGSDPVGAYCTAAG
jgi:hypothetical protein